MSAKRLTMWTTLLCAAAVAKLAAAQAQGGSIGSVPGDGTCDLGGLSEAIDAVNSRCCPDDQCGCPTPCSSALLPLLDDCRPVLDALLDMDDGVEDGVAGMLDVIKDQCLATPSADVLDELKEMHDAGTCSDETLNGVAQTEVTAAPCADSGRVKCAALLLAGLTCKDTDMVTNCVATCNLCGHRRAQITMRCKDFEEKVETVNTACCDYEGCSGVPTTCDAKCAIVYNDFFDQCASKLEDNIQPSEIQAYRNLHTTCAGLPVEPLMRALIACQVPSPPLPPHAHIYLRTCRR